MLLDASGCFVVSVVVNTMQLGSVIDTSLLLSPLPNGS